MSLLDKALNAVDEALDIGYCLSCESEQETDPTMTKEVCHVCGKGSVYGALFIALNGEIQ